MAILSDNGFPTFLFQCKTIDPAYVQPREIIDQPFIRKFAEALQTNNRLLVVKSRQMMASWIGCAYLIYRAATDGPGIHLIVSKEERSAKILIDRVRFLIDQHPDKEWAESVRCYSGTVAFPELGSRIISLPAAPYAVRGLSPQTVFWDEMAFTPNDEEIWAAIKPAVDSGGAFFGVSTPNGPSGVFARLVHSEEPGFTVFRIHYKDNPERDSQWETSARIGLSQSRWRCEYELSFEGGEGKVYDQFEETIHLLDQSYFPCRLPNGHLYRGIDFGYRHPAAVWAEYGENGVLTFFHCLVGDRLPLDQFVQEIRAVDAQYGISEKDFTFTAVDPAGAAKTDQGISPVEALLAAGFKLTWSQSSIAAGIEVVRMLLRDAGGNVRLKVDRRCGALIRGFQGYTWAPDGELPVKDGIHDHPMDALRYLAVNLHRAQHRLPDLTPLIQGLAPPPHCNPMITGIRLQASGFRK